MPAFRGGGWLDGAGRFLTDVFLAGLVGAVASMAYFLLSSINDFLNRRE